MINACIFDNNGNAVGCITPSVLKQFQLQLDTLSDIDVDLFLKLREMLEISIENNTAEFLNGLKIILNNYKYDYPEEMMRKISKSYHNLVRYCCSQAVYDEVFNETISFLRENGLEYKGKDTQGVDVDECAFEYNGITVGIKIRNESDLYNIYTNRDNLIQAVVYFKDRKYIITEVFIEIMAQSIKACIDDCRDVMYIAVDIPKIIQEILNVASSLINR